jgi:hypothetical protein
MLIFKQLLTPFKACCSIALSATTMFITKTKYLKKVSPTGLYLDITYLKTALHLHQKNQCKLECFLSFLFQDLTFLALIFPGTNNKNCTESCKFAYLHPEDCSIKLFHTRAQCYKTFYNRRLGMFVI